MGSYEQNSATTYLVQLDQNSSSLLDVTTTATLDNAPVSIVLLDPTLHFNYPYLILQTGDGITGTFASPTFEASTDINTSLVANLLLL